MICRMMSCIAWLRGAGQVEHPKHNKVQNANFTELLYADDTICVTNGIAPMQFLVRSIEKINARWAGFWF